MKDTTDRKHSIVLIRGGVFATSWGSLPSGVPVPLRWVGVARDTLGVANRKQLVAATREEELVEIHRTFKTKR